MTAGSETRDVVLVEDDEDSRELLVMMLENAGFSVSAFANAETALEETAAAPTPFLVITDVTLPGISGSELVRRLRASKAHADLKAFALTGHSAADVAAEAPGTFDKIFVKPMDMAVVVDAVVRA